MAIKIFLSYARTDGRELALWLHTQLTTQGFDVWLDTSDIDGGANWSQEIEQAIDTCEIALALLSTGSYRSEICRAEQGRARRKNKRIIPILVHPNADIPLELETRNYLDFSDSTARLMQFQTLLGDIAGEKPIEDKRNPKPRNNAPKPPLNFIPRPSDLERLRQAVIGDGTDRHIALTALKGMGGIGKTTLAQALCHDEVIQDAFPDGIAWITVGREPGELTSRIQTILHTIEGVQYQFNTQEAAVRHLHEILPNKAALIVMDDVWDENPLTPFEIEMPRARIFVTTRELSRFNNTNLVMSEVKLDVLEPAQAVELLQKYTSEDVGALEPVAKRLGYLPLALEIAGGQIAEQHLSAAEYLQIYERVSDMSADPLNETRKNSVKVCFEVSLQALGDKRILFDALGIFPQDVVIPQSTVILLWQALDQSMNRASCLQLLASIGRREIIRYDAEHKTIALHDLLHDYAEEKLHDSQTYVSTHSKLIRAYNPNGKSWWEIPHDGYLYFHLAYHLKKLGQIDELHSLLTDSSDWMNAKFTACEGDASYVDDLMFMIDDFRDSMPLTQLPELFALWAARQVVNQCTNTYTDDMLKALVRIGREREALNHARLRSEMSRRFFGIYAICEALKQRGKDIHSLIRELEVLVSSHTHTVVEQDRLLLHIAILKIRNRELDQAEHILALMIDEHEVAYLQNALASALAKDKVFTRAIEIAKAITIEDQRVNALIEVGCELVLAGKINEALLITDLLQTQQNRERALSQFIAAYVQTQQCDYEFVFQLLGSITDTKLREHTLISVSYSFCCSRQYEQSISIAQTIDDRLVRSKALFNLNSRLIDDGEFNLATEIAHMIEDHEYRICALCNLALSLIDPQPKAAHAIFTDIRTLIDTTLENWMRDIGLSHLTIALANARELQMANTTLEAISDDERKVYTLCEFAQISFQKGQHSLASKLIRQGLQIAEGIFNKRQKSELFILIIDTLAIIGEPETAYKLINRVRNLDEEFDALAHAQALRHLGQALAQFAQFTLAERIMDLISDAEQKIRAWLLLAQVLHKAGLSIEAQNTINKATKLSNQEYNRSRQVQFLSWIGQTVAEIGHAETATHFFELAHQSLAQIDERMDRDKALDVLAKAWVWVGKTDKALQLYGSGEDKHNYGSFLWTLASAYIDRGNIEESVQAIHNIPRTNWKAQAFSELAIKLEELGQTEASLQAFDNAREESTQISNLSERVYTYSKFAYLFAKSGKTTESQYWFSQSYQCIEQMEDEWVISQAKWTLANYLGRSGQIPLALGTMSMRSFDEFIIAVTTWYASFTSNNREQGLTVFISSILETIRVFAWVHPHWKPIYSLLKEEFP